MPISLSTDRDVHVQVSWYTKGEMIDACGTKRYSGFHFKWAALSVLNDDPPLDTIQHLNEYITCFDAITEAVHDVDPELMTMGPEQWLSQDNLEYYKHFVNGTNHKDGKPPQLISAHHVSNHNDHCEYGIGMIINRHYSIALQRCYKCLTQLQRHHCAQRCMCGIVLCLQ